MNSPNCSSEAVYATFPVVQDEWSTPAEEQGSEMSSAPMLGLFWKVQAASKDWYSFSSHKKKKKKKTHPA